MSEAVGDPTGKSLKIFFLCARDHKGCFRKQQMLIISVIIQCLWAPQNAKFYSSFKKCTLILFSENNIKSTKIQFSGCSRPQGVLSKAANPNHFRYDSMSTSTTLCKFYLSFKKMFTLILFSEYNIKTTKVISSKFLHGCYWL